MDEGPGTFVHLREVGRCLDVAGKQTDEEGDEPIERSTRSEVFVQVVRLLSDAPAIQAITREHRKRHLGPESGRYKHRRTNRARSILFAFPSAAKSG